MHRNEENLADMVNRMEENTPAATEPSLDLPEEQADAQADQTTAEVPTNGGSSDPATPAPEEAATTEAPVEEVEGFDITTISLQSWIEQNSSEPQFENVRYHKAAIRGVDPNDTLIVSDLNPTGGGVDGHPKRKLFLLNQASLSPVLNLPGIMMHVFNNDSYRILHPYGENVVLKCYGVKTGLIITMCQNVNVDEGVNLYIPVTRLRLKKKDAGLNVPDAMPSDMAAVLTEPVDMEAVELQYKQITRHKEGLNTKLDVINWLLAKQEGVTDVNHLLQIDDVIINIVH